MLVNIEMPDPFDFVLEEIEIWKRNFTWDLLSSVTTIKTQIQSNQYTITCL